MSLTNPWVLIGIALLCVASFFSGVKVEADHRDAQLLVQERAMHEAFVARAALLRGNADTIGGQLNAALGTIGAMKIDFDRQLDEANHANNLSRVTCPPAGKPGDLPAAPVVLINASVWDAALQAGPGPGGDPGKPDGAGAGADPAFAPLEAAYRNLGENGQQYARCRAKVTQWQALAIKNGWVKSQ